MDIAIIVISLFGIALAGLLLYAGVRGLRTYHFPTKEEWAERNAKAHKLYLQRETEKAERKRIKKELKKRGYTSPPCMGGSSRIMDVVLGRY